MARAERRIFALNDEIERLEAELLQARSELDVLRSLADDAERDAAVFDTPYDREDERDAIGDVARFRRVVAHFEERIAATKSKRDRFMDKLG